MRKTFTRSVATGLTAATIATSFTVTQAIAATTLAVAKPVAVTSDFSARRWHGANAAVAFGAMALIAGAAIAASQRDDYCGPYGCGYAYVPGPYYYGYGPGYYGGGYRWHHWHHHWR